MGTKNRSTLRNNNRDERRGDFFRDDFDDDFDDEEEIRGGVGVVCIRDDEYDDDASNDDCEGEFRRRMRKTSLATSLPKQEARRLGRAPLDIIVVVEIIIIVLDDDDDDGQESRRRA